MYPFQSSPGPKAGCYACANQDTRTSQCSFNPHPARRPGATCHHRGTCNWLNVSILTRPEGRVLRGIPFTTMEDAGVSILTRPEGRVLLLGLIILDYDILVSILTRPEGRVLPNWRAHRVACTKFQSSPGPKAGCYGCRRARCAGRPRFQSSPGPKAGCYLHGSRLPGYYVHQVSILTRPEGRVLRS